MRVQVSAFALALACDRAIEQIRPLADEEHARITAGRNRKVRWWDVFIYPIPMPPSMSYQFLSSKLVSLNAIRAIARYKRPDILIEMTAEELELIATWLPEFESERI